MAVRAKIAPMDAELPDPRVFAVHAANRPSIVDTVIASLAATSAEAAAAADRQIDREIVAALAAPATALRALLDAADSPAIYRHLWRRLTQVMSVAEAADGAGVAVTPFAIALVIVAGCDEPAPRPPLRLPGTLDNVAALADILRAHGALAGNVNFALANAVASAASIDLAEMPRLRAAALRSLAADATPLAITPSPIDVAPGESVHLRFLVGSALTAPGVRLFDSIDPGAWAMPLAQALARTLATPAATVLALPRAPASLPQALLAGRLAQREVSAQLFVTNALRRMRSSTGEPTAIVSAHRLDDGKGELRLSLSSPFSPRDAEGFRCPLFRFERVGDAATMLDDLLRDCRVTDVRVQPGVHGDRDPATGLTLLFKPTAYPAAVPDIH